MMRHGKQLTLITSMLLGFGTMAGAQVEDRESDPAQMRQEAMEWLDGSADVVLLKPADVQALQDKVSNMSPEELKKWWQETRPLRATLESPEWQETRAWLRDFLDVQAMYSEEEIDKFRGDFAKMSPAEMMDVIDRIQRKHQSLISMHRASERNRQASLSFRNQMVQQQRSGERQEVGGHSPTQAPPNVGPAKSSYAQRMNVYRRNFFIWWWRW